MKIELPWPSPKLHPNARCHWAVKAKEAKKARSWAHSLTIWSGSNLWRRPSNARLPVAITFHPPDKRRRDMDGMLSACKSQIDGISDALMVNDSLFDFTLNVREPVKGGKVVVEIV